jgi:hypothetical protein
MVEAASTLAVRLQAFSRALLHVHHRYTCCYSIHMTTRIHLVIDERERDAFRARAAAEGVSLSEWLRDAARERLERERPMAIRTVADLERFFDERAKAEAGAEPDWEQHLGVIERSRRAGLEAP